MTPRPRPARAAAVRVAAALAATAIALTGCDAGPGTDAGMLEQVTVGAVLEPTSLDVLTVAGAALDQVLLDNVYETLLKTTDDGEIVPGLAELPTVSADGLTYTFAVKRGVRFSDGTPLTAADAAWSLQQVSSPASKSPKAAAFTAVRQVTAPDDATLVVTLKQRDTNLTFNLTERGGAVLRRNASNLAGQAVGTGPWKLNTWNRGSYLAFDRNDDYHGERPVYQHLVFRYFTDPNAAVNALTTRDVDILTGIDPGVVGPLKDNPDLVVNQGTTDGEITLGFNNARGALRDVRVRRAIRQAIDHEGLLQVFDGFGTLIGGPVPPTDPWYEDLRSTAPYDPAAAKRLLAEAGHASGLNLQFVVPNITYATRSAEYVASQLREVGVGTTIRTVEFAGWLDQVYTKADYDLTVVNHVEPRDLANYANPQYYWRYDSPQVQRDVAAATTAASPEEATTFLRDAARQVATDAAADWLLLGADITASTKHFVDYPTRNTASRFDASRIRLDGP
jgi:peptide/nickel transport system substrate-binding protein